MTPKKPWLYRKEWKDNNIHSGAKFAMYILWGFTFIWNLISLPIIFTDQNLLNTIQQKPITALVFIFPFVGILLILLSINSFHSWRKFGSTNLVLDPFPGSISGDVGGRVFTNIKYDESIHYAVTLSSIHSYISGTGKDRSRREKVQWQSEGICFSSNSINGTELSFRFNVPDNLSESDEKHTSSFYLWRVSISADLPGTDFDRSFEIPVYKGHRLSTTINSYTEDFHLTLDSAHKTIYDIAEVIPFHGGFDINFPAFKRPTNGIMATIFGSIFIIIGYSIWKYGDAPIIFPFAFIPIGALIFCVGIWDLFKSLSVRVDRETLKTRRFFLGYPMISKTINTKDISSLELKEGSSISNGKKTTIFYSLIAHTNNANRIIVAERLFSKPEAQLIKDNFNLYLK